MAPIPTGRDVSSAETPGPSGLMAGKRSLDGNNAAYDMRSLGKHIEAVSVTGFFPIHPVSGSGLMANGNFVGSFFLFRCRHPIVAR